MREISPLLVSAGRLPWTMKVARRKTCFSTLRHNTEIQSRSI